MPVRVIVTKGTTADCTKGEDLIDNIEAENLLADRGYDTDKIINKARNKGMNVVIPPKRNRIIQREYDKYLYKIRHKVENAFLHLKRFRGIATRYAKNINSFLSMVQIGCLMLWAKIS